MKESGGVWAHELHRGRQISVAAAAGLAAALGVGRFVFTPILPIMVDTANITPSGGAVIATANYAGYLLGAVLLSIRPGLNTTTSFRAWTVILVASEAAMAIAGNIAMFSVFRFVAGLASAAIFLACASTVAKHAKTSPGITFGGVGAGIAASGILVLIAAPHLSWEGLWLCSTILSAVLVAPAWILRIHAEAAAHQSKSLQVTDAIRRIWRMLLLTYFLEGLGYIIIGTFLVAAVGGHDNPSVGPVVWVVVGIAGVPATVLWQAIGRRIGNGQALVAAFALQTVSALLPALTQNSAVAVASAILFGGTFMGIVMLTLTTAARLPIGRTAAALTSVYGVGQVLGPLVVAPAIGDSYTVAFVIATIVLALGCVGALILCRLLAQRVATGTITE